MFRTVFSIGLFAVLGLIALKVIFGVFAFAVVIFLKLLYLAFWVGLLGFAVYLIIRVVSPDTARRFRERWGGGA